MRKLERSELKRLKKEQTEVLDSYKALLTSKIDEVNVSFQLLNALMLIDAIQSGTKTDGEGRIV